MTDHDTAPIDFTQVNMSDGILVNPFLVYPEWRFSNPIQEAIERLGHIKETEAFMRFDLLVPLGCPFSLFLVIREDETGLPHATVVFHRKVAISMTMDDPSARMFEWPINVPQWMGWEETHDPSTD